MLEIISKLYVMAMAGQVRSPVPHLFGPPGCGKSTVVEQLADLLGVTLHTINVSRISPLELEGVQMPVEDNTRLHLLTATFWTQLKSGDILLLDEFLRGYPEVYNGLLDILTSRRVGGYQLPDVFIIAASNTTVAYDKALEDRLLHIPVPDPRKSKREEQRLAKLLVDALGLMPEMATSMEMQSLLDTEIKPTYEILDQLKHRANASAITTKGCSIRNLIGQAQLRHVKSTALRDLIQMNNVRAINKAHFQYVLLLDGKKVDSRYVNAARQLRGDTRLSKVQALNLELNLQLIEMEEARQETLKEEEEQDDDTFVQ